MTNREWLNTLSDEEWLKNVSILTNSCEWCGLNKLVRKCPESESECDARKFNWLSQQHETTADEDFADIGCFKVDGCKSQYKEKVWDKYFRVDKEGCAFWTYRGGGEWTENQIDQIRKIADKKRKEMGWK